MINHTVRDILRYVRRKCFVEPMCGVLDLLLDDNIIQLIKKYEAQGKKADRQQGLHTIRNLDLKLIGIRVFILYQKSITIRDKIKGKLIYEGRLVLNLLDDCFGDFKSNFIVQKTCIAIDTSTIFIRNSVKQAENMLRQLVKTVIYNPKTQQLLIFGDDVSSLLSIIMKTIWDFTISTVKFTRSRTLYNRIMQKYKNIQNQCKAIKEESEIMSNKLFSEEDDDFFDNRLKVRVKKYSRSMKSEDNLYSLRKKSVHELSRQIDEEEEDRSEYHETDNMDDPSFS